MMMMMMMMILKDHHSDLVIWWFSVLILDRLAINSDHDVKSFRTRSLWSQAGK